MNDICFDSSWSTNLEFEFHFVLCLGSVDADQVSPEFPMQSSGSYRPISTTKTYDYADCPHQYEELPNLQ